MDLKPQAPAKGIMLQGDYGNSKNFKVECDCSAEDHSVYMWIEINENPDIPDIDVSFYVRTWTPLWEGWKARLKAVYEILFKGVHKQEHHMLLSEQSAINFAHVILDTVNQIKEVQKNGK